MTIDDLVDAGRLSLVEVDRAAASALLEDAARHIVNAEMILRRGDPNGAYSLAYDATRKAITADMRASGYRLRNRPRAHQAVVDYAVEALGSEGLDDALDNLDRIRRTRHAGEYEARYVDDVVVAADLALMKRIVEAVQLRV